jgi:rhodanese-related sulfurtransferase
MTTTLKSGLSRVLETSPADPKKANEHFLSRLAFETDPSDVYADLQSGETGFIVLDARSAESYARGHVPGAINFPHRNIEARTVGSLPRDKLIVTYCDGVFCNASTKAAAKLTALGFKVKEMIHGMAGWREERYPIETGIGPVRLEK